MKKIKLFSFGVLLVFAIIGNCYANDGDTLNLLASQARSELPKVIEDHRPLAVRQFESNIEQLMVLSPDDTIKDIHTSYPYNLIERKKHFTEKGWKSYLSFVELRKKNLVIGNAERKRTHQQIVNLDKNTIIYSDGLKGIKNLKAEGFISYSNWHVYLDGGDRFEISVNYTEPDRKIDNWKFKITKWSSATFLLCDNVVSKIESVCQAKGGIPCESHLWLVNNKKNELAKKHYYFVGWQCLSDEQNSKILFTYAKGDQCCELKEFWTVDGQRISKDSTNPLDIVVGKGKIFHGEKYLKDEAD